MRVKLITRFVSILRGKSYYHRPQRIGKIFCPGDLAGYFNDLTAKTQWTGNTDKNGIPVNVLVDGRKLYFITTIVQKALGHWDKWLITKNVTDRNEFLKLVGWLVKHQDAQGGWPIFTLLNLPSRSPYSAMTQGECISAFVRAWMLTNNPLFKDRAERALNILIKPVEKGGTAVFEGEDLFLEEVPLTPRTTILNGWIFALFGLYDYWLAFEDEVAKKFFVRSVNTLKKYLHKYDAGYWSYYNIRKTIASPFYHHLHISQLEALELILPDIKIFSMFREKFQRYSESRLKKIRAISKKICQNLKNPPKEVIIR